MDEFQYKTQSFLLKIVMFLKTKNTIIFVKKTKLESNIEIIGFRGIMNDSMERTHQ